jgi:hypothetical protein
MHRIPVTVSSDTRDLPFVDGFDEQLQVLKRCRRQHPVPEIEDVARLSAGTAKHIPRAFANQIGRTEEHCGIEVALDASIVTHALPTIVQRHSPVEGHYVRPGRRD